MLDAAWPAVSSRRRPLRRAGCARIAREPRSFSTRAVRDVSDPSFAGKQQSIATSGVARLPGRTLARGAFSTRPRAQWGHHELNGKRVHSRRRRS
eukprot:15431510-Alexandrium_andersonii.AAC.1